MGIFGVMSYMVLRRTKEIGIRVALGAAPGQVAAWWRGSASRSPPSVVLLGVAALATYLPARRATRVDPVSVLNREG